MAEARTAGFVRELESGDGLRLFLTAKPKSGRDAVVVDGDVLVVQVRAVAEGGRANDAVVRLLADVLDVRARDVVVVRGATARRKEIVVRGIAVERAVARLQAAAG